MTKYIQGKDGKMAGSIGDGKTRVPTASDVHHGAVLTDDTPAPGYDTMYDTFASTLTVDDPYLAAAEEREHDAVISLHLATERLAAATTTLRTPIPEIEAEKQARADRVAALEALAEDGKAAVRACEPHLVRIYRDAGVPEGTAKGLAASVITDALRGREANPSRWSKPWAQPVNAPWVMEHSAFPEQTAAAVTAAKSDPDYLAARRKVGAILRKVDALYKTAIPRDADAHALAQQRTRQYYAARDARDAAEKAVDAARMDVVEARARQAAGVPADAVRTGLEGRELRDAPTISRNPDGSTNTWVWYPPTADHPDGEYAAVVSVTTTQGNFAGANALVTADGKTHSRVEHYFRGPGRGFNANPIVVVAPPQDGATPLADEGLPDSGYSVFIDSTD